MTRKRLVLSWLLQLTAAAILAQTLFFKFTYAPETQWIFGTKLGVGRAGATAAGLLELVAVILLLIPRRAIYGALVGLAAMAGAIGAHLTVLGIESRNPLTNEGDGGALFALGIVVALLCLGVLALRREEWPRLRLATR